MLFRSQLILEGILKAEKLIPGGGKELIQLIKSEVEPKNNFIFIPPNKEHLIKEIEELGHNNKIIEICMTALELAGSDGKILVEQGNSNELSIELRVGSQFNLLPLLGDCDIKNCKVAVIDGYIESISEIHHFLTQVSESGDDVFMFFRGCSDDVISTLSINLRRNTVRVRPIIVKFDEKGINTLKDICVVTGAPLVSSDLGSLISNIKLADLPRIKRIQISGNKVYIESPERKKIIESHFSNLLEKMSEDSNEFKFELLKQRTSSLSSRQITIRIPDDVNYITTKKSLDECFRSISYLTRNGVCSDKKLFINSVLYDLSKSIKESINANFLSY